MGMTLTQKILAAHAGLAEVKAGQLINAKLDIVLGNDITTPVAINEPKELAKLLLHLLVPIAIIHVQGDDGTAIIYGIMQQPMMP